MNAALLPPHVHTRADLDSLLQVLTNYEERMPARMTDPAFDLSRMQTLLARRAHPERGPATVHVAGSKGKGTLCRLIAAGCVAHAQDSGGAPVGLYLSPHLTDLRERVEVDGLPVRDSDLCEAAHSLLPLLRDIGAPAQAPTFFELMTAMAWEIFRARGVGTVVLETGLGGRLDATNVCKPVLTAITSIELEHTALLGSTVALIAAEKAGILKPGIPCVVTAVGEARDVIRAHAARVGAPLLCVGEEIQVLEARTGPGARLQVRVRTERGEERQLLAPLAGVHHASGLAAADAVLRELSVGSDAARRGLAGATLPGVLEVVREEPLVLVDGAHTQASAHATRAALRACWPDRPIVLLVGILAEKDIRGVLAGLASQTEHVVLTCAPSPRSADPELLRQSLPPDAGAARVIRDPALALEQALAVVPVGGLLLVSGSVYLAGAAKGLLAPAHAR